MFLFKSHITIALLLTNVQNKCAKKETIRHLLFEYISVKPNAMKREEAIDMYKVQHERFHKTQDLQWKFNISLWTLMTAAIYFFNEYYKSNDKIAPSGTWILVIVFFLTHTFFALIVQNSLAVTKAVWIKILDDLNPSNNNDISIDIDTVTTENRYDKKKFWKENWKWILFQMLITIILLSTFVLIIL